MPELQHLKVGDTVPDSADYSIYYRPLWAIPIIELMLNAGDLVNVTFMLRNVTRLMVDREGPHSTS